MDAKVQRLFLCMAPPGNKRPTGSSPYQILIANAQIPGKASLLIIWMANFGL